MTDQNIAVVTGAANGIGAEIGRTFEREGAAVALLDIQAERLRETWPGHELLLGADISDLASMRAAAAEVEARHGHVNAIIANAGGVFEELRGVAELAPEVWQRTIDVNLTGAFNTVHAFLPLLRRAPGRKSIVLTSSVLGIRGSGFMTAYSAAKAGILGMMTALAQDLGREGITVNAVAPCLVRSDGFEALAGEKALRTLHSQIPLGRLGENSDIAHAVSYLAGEQSSFVTGQLLVVDGGMVSTAWWHPYWA